MAEDKHQANKQFAAPVPVSSAQRRRLSRYFQYGIVMFGSALLWNTGASAFDWTTVANSDTVVPNAGTAKFSSFNQPSINNNCTVIFRGRGKGPQAPSRGIYIDKPCSSTDVPVKEWAAVGELVPVPNNTAATFNEFPSIPRIDIRGDFVATRGQSKPVWTYTLPDNTDTKVGTAGVYAGLLTGELITGASLLGAVPEFSQFDVPGFPGVKFDQFPGAPVPFGGRRIAFKGNFTDGTTPHTGVYYRSVFSKDNAVRVKKVADTTMLIPGTNVFFGSTAPPSAVDTTIVFSGSDNEDSPTAGGLYRYYTESKNLETLVAIGGPVPKATDETFAMFGEGLSYDGVNLGFWGSWGTAKRTVTVHCPMDGNADLIAECIKQCPDVDQIGNYCEKEVPVNQGIFVRRGDGSVKVIARAGSDRAYQDFLYWVFSGRPPGAGDSTDGELPRWRSSAFVAISPYGTSVATVFKGSKAEGESGLYMRRTLDSKIKPVVLVGDQASTIDPMAPAGAAVTAVGVERDGFRYCKLAINASFLDSVTSESWAGVYVEQNACITQ